MYLPSEDAADAILSFKSSVVAYVLGETPSPNYERMFATNVAVVGFLDNMLDDTSLHVKRLRKLHDIFTLNADISAEMTLVPYFSSNPTSHDELLNAVRKAYEQTKTDFGDVHAYKMSLVLTGIGERMFAYQIDSDEPTIGRIVVDSTFDKSERAKTMQVTLESSGFPISLNLYKV